jgi:UDP-3-O-[3-hydroxymyristoyl] glucosamine N-acyltransferase
MKKNIFFKRKGPFLYSELFPNLKFKKKLKVFDIKNLNDAKSSDLTFLDNIDYIEFAKFTKASYCITTEKYIYPKIVNLYWLKMYFLNSVR